MNSAAEVIQLNTGDKVDAWLSELDLIGDAMSGDKNEQIAKLQRHFEHAPVEVRHHPEYHYLNGYLDFAESSGFGLACSTEGLAKLCAA